VTRLGWGILAVFLLAAIVFVAMVGPPLGMALSNRDRPIPQYIAVHSGPGVLGMPVAGVQAGALVDSFSDPRGGGRVHGAIDIPAPRGTMVLAVADGQVEKLFESRLGGHTLYQRSADGSAVYYYAHLDGYAPGMGDGVAVRMGQPIAFVGSTGDADPAAPHLHFEVHRMAPGERWWQGTAVNPYPLLAGNTVAR